MGSGPAAAVRLGLAANRSQFLLLVAVNAFVGAMVGLERAIMPGLAAAEFGVATATSVLAFIGTFGLAKAFADLWAGSLADRVGRRRVLLLGWLVGVPVPLLVLVAPGWEWVVFANLLLGVNQGLAWSMTVNMKIDLVGPARRGLALGLNEASGYVAVALAAFASGVLAESFGYRPVPFYVGLAVASAGLALSALAVRETRPFVELETSLFASSGARTSIAVAFRDGTWRRGELAVLSQAGLVNNANDAIVWGAVPILLAERGLDAVAIGLVAAAYPAAWGLLQLLTGAASDAVGRTPLIVAGMLVQAASLLLFAAVRSTPLWLAAAVALGVGTAMVYPTLIAAVGDRVAPAGRAVAVSVYRFWRDVGTMLGALGGGLLADALGVPVVLVAVGALTAVSGLVALLGRSRPGRNPERGSSLARL